MVITIDSNKSSYIDFFRPFRCNAKAFSLVFHADSVCTSGRRHGSNGELRRRYGQHQLVGDWL